MDELMREVYKALGFSPEQIDAAECKHVWQEAWTGGKLCIYCGTVK